MENKIIILLAVFIFIKLIFTLFFQKNRGRRKRSYSPDWNIFDHIIQIIVSYFTSKRTKQTYKALPYEAVPLLSPSERVFYHVLSTIVSADQRINCKTRLQGIIDAEKGINMVSCRNHISCRHVDFVVYDPIDGKPLYAIELDDSSHEHKEQKKIDALKDMIFKQAGIPLVRIPVQRTYDRSEIIEKIQIAVCKQ